MSEDICFVSFISAANRLPATNSVVMTNRVAIKVEIRFFMFNSFIRVFCVDVANPNNNLRAKFLNPLKTNSYVFMWTAFGSACRIFNMLLLIFDIDNRK